MREVVIVDAVRTPFGRRSGSLKDVRPDDLLAVVLEELIRRNSVDGAEVEDVIVGCVTQIEEQGWNVARLASLSAGLPVEVPATTVNRMCGSGQQGAHFGAQAILAGDMDVVVAAGVESMSRVKMGSDGKDFSPQLEKKYDLVWQGISAEMMASKWRLSRRQLDEFSLESHHRALNAVRSGLFSKETMPVAVTGDGGETRMFDSDEGPRTDTSIEKLSALAPAFKPDGVITAGNSSQISDGAAALLLMSSTKAKDAGAKPRARMVARTVVGSDPVLMLDGVIPATQKVLARAGLVASDIDVFEINEAFASVVLAWAAEIGPDMTRVNPNGGAIALGHPLGATGCRLMGALVNELERRDARWGLQTMCIGHGMATATVIERLD